jgi:hypothetical protein
LRAHGRAVGRQDAQPIRIRQTGQIGQVCHMRSRGNLDGPGDEGLPACTLELTRGSAKTNEAPNQQPASLEQLSYSMARSSRSK